MNASAATDPRPRVRDHGGARVAGDTRPRFSGSERGSHGRSHPRRNARRRCSHPPASTTFGYDRVGCSVFLNNRYYDSTTGVFLSVDPLVAVTGEAYLYASGNPSTLSDPTGLMPPGFGDIGFSRNGMGGWDVGSYNTRYETNSQGQIEYSWIRGQSQRELNAENGRAIYFALFGSVTGGEAHHNWPMFMGGPRRQTLTKIQSTLHRAIHEYIYGRIQEDFGFNPRGKSGPFIRDQIDRHAVTNDPDVERREWMRDVINEDGFEDIAGGDVAGEIQDNFGRDFSEMEYTADSYGCACPGWYPVGGLPPGYTPVPVIPGMPIIPGTPLQPVPLPGFPGFPVPIPLRPTVLV